MIVASALDLFIACLQATVLANTTEDKIKLAYEYGKNLGILFQVFYKLLFLCSE